MNNLTILYEDNHIIVVVKPSNVLSQGDSTGDLSIVDMVKQYIKEKYNKPGNVYLGLVHRLDRPVGGIMVFARTSKAASRLSKEFQGHNISKKYLAVVHGKFSEDKGRYVDFIKRDDNGKSIISKDGKEAILEYKILAYDTERDCSLVEVDLKTGRHHQIRVQFASRGHYLIGDQRYGFMDKKQIHLFAYYLSFVHPVRKEIMKFLYFPENKDYWALFNFSDIF